MISRTELSRIENGFVSPNLDVLVGILTNLQLSLPEYIKIENTIAAAEDEKIVAEFMQIANTTDLDRMTRLRDQALAQIESEKNTTLGNIVDALNGLITYQATDTFSAAEPFAQKVWQSVSHRETPFLVDLFLINDILFLFPPSVAIDIEQRAAKQIDLYFADHQSLTVAFKLNLAFMLMSNKMYAEAKPYLNDASALALTIHRFDLFAIAEIRLGYCVCPTDEERVSRAFMVLKATKQSSLITEIHKELSELGLE